MFVGMSYLVRRCSNRMMPSTRLFCLSALFFPLSLTAESPYADTATCVAAGWKHRIWALYPVEKLKAEESLPPTPTSECVSLIVARGESEPFVLALRSDVPLRQVAVTCGALQTDGGDELPADSFSVKRVAYIHVDEPSGTRIGTPMPYVTCTGDIPDPLLEGPGDARPGRNLQFLVSVTVPRSAKPGRYTGTVALRFRREGWMPADMPDADRVPLTVQVRSFAFPEISPLLNTCVASPQALPAWLKRPALLTALRQDFIASGQVPDPLPSPELRREKDGSLSIDSTGWERAAASLFDEGHASHLFLPVWRSNPDAPLQGVYFLWHYPAVTRQRWFGAVVCDEDGGLTADFRQTFGYYLQHMRAVIERRGWRGRIFITTMDEPYTYHIHGDGRDRDTPENNYRVISNFVSLVRATAPNLRTFVTADPTPALNGLIDHWCLRNLQHAADARERAGKYGETVTFCDNYRSFIDYPAVSTRSLGWLAWKLGASGWLTYEVFGSLTTAWEGPAFVYPHFNGGTVWGMGQLFYPDTEGLGGIAPSLRWVMMREGCDDYAYLWTLRERLNRLPVGQRHENAAREARALLDTAAGQVVGGSGDAETTSSATMPNAQSNLIPHLLRQKMGDLIEQLPGP